MNCESSEIVDNCKAFDCSNMGNVLGKECEKENSLARSVDNGLCDEASTAISSGGGSESDFEKVL